MSTKTDSPVTTHMDEFQDGIADFDHRIVAAESRPQNGLTIPESKTALLLVLNFWKEYLTREQSKYGTEKSWGRTRLALPGPEGKRFKVADWLRLPLQDEAECFGPVASSENVAIGGAKACFSTQKSKGNGFAHVSRWRMYNRTRKESLRKRTAERSILCKIKAPKEQGSSSSTRACLTKGPRGIFLKLVISNYGKAKD